MWGSGTTDCVWIAPEHFASDDRYVVRVTDVDALHTILTCSSSSFVVSLKLGWHALFGWIKVSPESGPDVRCNAGRYRRVVWPTVDLWAMQTMSYETGETDENKRIRDHCREIMQTSWFNCSVNERDSRVVVTESSHFTHAAMRTVAASSCPSFTIVNPTPPPPPEHPCDLSTTPPQSSRKPSTSTSPSKIRLGPIPIGRLTNPRVHPCTLYIPTIRISIINVLIWTRSLNCSSTTTTNSPWPIAVLVLASKPRA